MSATYLDVKSKSSVDPQSLVLKDTQVGHICCLTWWKSEQDCMICGSDKAQSVNQNCAVAAKRCLMIKVAIGLIPKSSSAASDLLMLYFGYFCWLLHASS